MISAGIDVSAKQLPVAVSDETGHSATVKTFNNTTAGIQQLEEFLEKRQVTRVV